MSHCHSGGRMTEGHFNLNLMRGMTKDLGVEPSVRTPISKQLMRAIQTLVLLVKQSRLSKLRKTIQMSLTFFNNSLCA